MMTRILTSLYMLPFLYIIHLGGLPLYVVSLLLMVQGLKEYNNAMSNKENSTDLKILSLLAIIIFGLNIFTGVNGLKSIFIFVTCYILVIIFDLIVLKGKNISIRKRLSFWLGVSYVIVGFEAIVLIRGIVPNGELFTWLIFVITVTSDSMAYFTGKLFGKHKLVPSVSPNKTIEGSVGAVVFTAIACVLYGKIMNFDASYLIFIGVVGSVVSQLGDLIASKLKRCTGIKDFSNLIPEHGGVLDRLDSALLVSQFIFIVMIFLL